LKIKYSCKYTFGCWATKQGGGFNIVISNPPYGAKLNNKEKSFFKNNYQTAKTIKNVQKGSLDTYTLFIELGYKLLVKSGNLIFIVPISVTSSDALTGVHRLLENNCNTIRISSYSVRPQPVFKNAVVNTSIIQFIKTLTPCEQMFSTKMHRKGRGFNLQNLIENLQFAEVKDLKLQGRIPKISEEIEKKILNKIFQHKPLRGFIQEKGLPIYYRTTGGRYFKVVTNYSTGSTKENFITFDEKYSNLIGCILSSSLSFWFYQIFSNNLDWKSYEIESFTIPLEQLNPQNMKEITELYEEYLTDIERNANERISSGSSSYNVTSFKEYKIGKSKSIIDRIDDVICPLYGLTEEETEFIKNYEIEFRIATDE